MHTHAHPHPTQARQQRQQADWEAHNKQLLQAQAPRAAAIKEQWSTWNPYRKATQELCALIEQGALTLEVGPAAGCCACV